MNSLEEMSRASFKISYDGIGLQAHTISITDLAPALMALNSLFAEANKIINGDKAKVELKIKATAAGSFEMMIEFTQSICQQLISFFSSDGVNAAVNIKELILGGGAVVGGGSLGLIKLKKLLKGRTPEVALKADGKVLFREGDQEIEISPELYKLCTSPEINMYLSKVLAPLEKEDIDSFSVKEDNESTAEVTVNKEEREYFDIVPVDSEATVLKNEIEQLYYIISPVFKKDNKWRLSDGEININAIISDPEFLAEVESGERAFASDDMLKCRVRVSQVYSKGAIKHEYEVLKVLEHIKKPEQLILNTKKNNE